MGTGTYFTFLLIGGSVPVFSNLFTPLMQMNLFKELSLDNRNNLLFYFSRELDTTTWNFDVVYTAKRIVQEVIPHTGGSRIVLPFGQFRWCLIPTVVIWVCCLDLIHLPVLKNLTPVFTGFVKVQP